MILEHADISKVWINERDIFYLMIVLIYCMLIAKLLNFIALIMGEIDCSFVCIYSRDLIYKVGIKDKDVFL